MTKDEKERFDSLATMIYEMREEWTELSGRVNTLVELRMANGALSKQQFEALHEMCAERHGHLDKRVHDLSKQVDTNSAIRYKLLGALAPVASIIALLALILGFFGK